MTESNPRVEDVIPVVEEAITVSKCEVETGRVQVALTTEMQTVIARETLRGRRVEVEQVPMNRMLAEGEPLPQSREEGDTLIVPVVEEVAVVVKRLVLREEVRLRFVHTEEPFAQEVPVRRQRATIARVRRDAGPDMIRENGQ